MTPEDAQRFIDELLYPIRQHGADIKVQRNGYAERINALQLSQKKKYNLTEAQWKGEGEMPAAPVSEAGLVQLYGEKLIDRSTLVQLGANVEKIENAVETFREIYEELFDQIDRVRVANGYDPVGRIENYFPHFDNENDVLSVLAKGMGFDVVTNLPTEIAGQTANRKPGTRFSVLKVTSARRWTLSITRKICASCAQ